MKHTLKSLATFITKWTGLIRHAIYEGEYARALNLLDNVENSAYKVILDETIEDPEVSFADLRENDAWRKDD